MAEIESCQVEREKEWRVLDGDGTITSDEDRDNRADNEVREITSKWKRSGNAVKGPVGKKLKTDSVAADPENVDAENIRGKALRAVQREDLKEMGVKTMGRRILLTGEILGLLGSSCNSTAKESDLSCSEQSDRLLTHKEKKRLTMEDKAIYNTKKKLVIREVCKEWPEDKEIPWFAKNSTATGKLVAFVDRLVGDERFTYKKYGLGHNAIKDIVLTHMRERRRSEKGANLRECPGESDTVSADDSSSNNGSPSPSIYDKKRKEYVTYFNPELTQVSCDCIVMVALDKLSISMIQRAFKDLEKLKKLFGLGLLRGKDKNTFIRAIASVLLSNMDT